MNKLLMLIVVLASQNLHAGLNGITSERECTEQIHEHYDRKDQYVYSIRPLIHGRGRYATHFNYEIKYVRDKKNMYTEEGCIAKIHCADYHFEVITELEYCGS